MAAYPFGWNPPSIKQLIERCEEHGATLTIFDHEINGNFGMVKLRVLEREIDGEQYHVFLPPLDDDVLVHLLQVKAICDAIKIPTSIFGFEIDSETGFAKEVE